MSDLVHKPAHYNSKRFGDVECKEFARYMTFPAGNTFKYVWRHEEKDNRLQDLEKALEYNRWFWYDLRHLGTGAVLPGFTPHIRTLQARYLRGPFDKPVYNALNSVLCDMPESVDSAVRGELERLKR